MDAAADPSSTTGTPDSSRFTGSVVLVAGGTGGLGRAVSQAFLAAGATVVATYRNPSGLDELGRAAGVDMPRLDGQRVDVTDETAVLGLVGQIVTRHGRLDALVNTVGGYVGGRKLWELDMRDFERMLALNLRAGYVLARAVVPVLMAQARGSIVNVAAKAGIERPPGASAYAASKAAALAMMDVLAAELAGTGVRVNSVLPSIIDTLANRRDMPQADFSRWPKPADIARVILFLCSDDARVVHGASIPVYGNR